MKMQSKESKSTNLAKVDKNRELESKHTTDLEEWGKQTKTVTLTYNQIIALESYIGSTSYYRQTECNDSKNLVAMNHEDTDLYQSAKANIEYYQKLEKKLESIIEILRN